MFGIGTQELIILLVIALIVFGPSKLPELGASLGKSIREFKTATKDQANKDEANKDEMTEETTTREKTTATTGTRTEARPVATTTESSRVEARSVTAAPETSSRTKAQPVGKDETVR